MPKPKLLSSLHKRKSTHLPVQFHVGHELCFKVHDVLTQALVSGAQAKAFFVSLPFRDDEDLASFEAADDVFAWLEDTRRVEEREAVLITTITPAVLSDALHCCYEALESSRKAKLNISYILLRKPLQESLFLLEEMVLDRSGFAAKMVSDPTLLRSQTGGDFAAHRKRIAAVLTAIGSDHGFDASYLAQLRYDKNSEDSFSGICNKATHLFTTHPAIATELLNINFIFSNWESKLTWKIHQGGPEASALRRRLNRKLCSHRSPSAVC